MDILGIGPMELILVLIVALAVFGPDKLPTMGAKLGKALRDMRKATRTFSEEIGAPARELMEPFQEVGGAMKSIGEAASVARNPGEAIRQSVVKELKGATEDRQPAEAEPENRIAPPAAAGAEADAGAPGDSPADASADATVPPVEPPPPPPASLPTESPVASEPDPASPSSEAGDAAAPADTDPKG